MRKTADAPRRLYTNKGKTFVRFNARLFAAPSKSLIAPSAEVTCLPVESDGGRARVLVVAGNVKEVWKTFKV
jgi:hypothetical protein